MLSVLKCHMPPTQKKKSSSKTTGTVPWLNDSVYNAITKRQNFARLWRKDNIEFKRQILRTVRNEVCYVIEQCKQN